MEHLLQMRQFFNSGKTKPYTFRKTQLTKLRDAVIKFEEQIHQALYTDLKKNPEECWVTETGFLIAELNNAIKHLKAWMQPETVQTNLLNAPSKSFILQEPMGVVLIISPGIIRFNCYLHHLQGQWQQAIVLY